MAHRVLALGCACKQVRAAKVQPILLAVWAQRRLAGWSAAMSLGAVCAWFFLPSSVMVDHALPALVVFLAAIASSVAGFAFSALAGAFLFHMTQDALEALHVMLIASLAIQVCCTWQVRHHILPRSLLPHLAGGFATIPMGLYFLQTVPFWLHVSALGVFLMLYGTYMLLRPSCPVKSDSLAGQIIAGALGGITGTLAAFPSAFLAMWCACQGWSKKQQRAITQPYILVMQIAVFAALTTIRPLHTIRPELLFYALPALMGARIGLRIYDGLNTQQFNKLVCILLVVAGALLAAKGV